MGGNVNINLNVNRNLPCAPCLSHDKIIGSCGEPQLMGNAELWKDETRELSCGAAAQLIGVPFIGLNTGVPQDVAALPTLIVMKPTLTPEYMTPELLELNLGAARRDGASRLRSFDRVLWQLAHSLVMQHGSHIQG